jgi:cytochrome c biogenesis protein CcdA
MTHHQPNEQATPTSPRNTFSIIGIVAGVLALLLPIVFGPAGVILGVMARTRNERLANRALLVAATGMVVGLLVAFLGSGSR